MKERRHSNATIVVRDILKKESESVHEGMKLLKFNDCDAADFQVIKKRSPLNVTFVLKVFG